MCPFLCEFFLPAANGVVKIFLTALAAYLAEFNQSLFLQQDCTGITKLVTGSHELLGVTHR